MQADSMKELARKCPLVALAMVHPARREFAAESVEVVLASRRLENLPPTTKHASYTHPRMYEHKEGWRPWRNH
jgi:hypothetical protein